MMSNVQRLGNALHQRMNNVAKSAVPVTMELGTINSDMSLKVDSLSGNIPSKDYMKSIHLTSQNIYVPEIRRLKPGDRVLVCWVGYDPIVVDILVSGNS